MQRLPDQIEKGASNVVVSVVKAIDRDVVPHTPVDTTEGVSNWQASINEPAYLPLPAIFPGHHGSTAAGSREEAIAHVDRTLAMKEPGKPVILSNLASWIVDLNNGNSHSQQEPKGFVERAVLIGRLIVKRTKLGL